MNTSDILHNDLNILERFVELVPIYLHSETLFYPTGPNVPEMTFGGTLLRKARLERLKHLLSDNAQHRLGVNIANFAAALDEHVVAFENKCDRELAARLRQWKEFLYDLENNLTAANYYGTAIEPRVMIDVMLQQLAISPYQTPGGFQERILKLDGALRGRWRNGEFVWDAVWQPAYPQEDFWYLYGSPA